MKDRFLTLFDHDMDPMGIGWQQTRSLLALGGGKLTGQGLFHGTQTQSKSAWSLPARHTDFIFSVIGEELGMLGCLFPIPSWPPLSCAASSLPVTPSRESICISA